MTLRLGDAALLSLTHRAARMSLRLRTYRVDVGVREGERDAEEEMRRDKSIFS